PRRAKRAGDDLAWVAVVPGERLEAAADLVGDRLRGLDAPRLVDDDDRSATLGAALVADGHDLGLRVVARRARLRPRRGERQVAQDPVLGVEHDAALDLRGRDAQTVDQLRPVVFAGGLDLECDLGGVDHGGQMILGGCPSATGSASTSAARSPTSASSDPTAGLPRPPKCARRRTTRAERWSTASARSPTAAAATWRPSSTRRLSSRTRSSSAVAAASDCW